MLNRREFWYGAGAAAISLAGFSSIKNYAATQPDRSAAAKSYTGTINVADPPYNAGPQRKSGANTDAINRAIDDAPPGTTLLIPGPLTLAPEKDAYIKLHKPLNLVGIGWHSQINPDPDIESEVPIISIIGMPASILFNFSIRKLAIGPMNRGTPRQGGHAIRVEASQSDGGMENCEIEDIYVHGGKYRERSYGIHVVHSSSDDRGAIYNFTIRQCQIMGGIRMQRVADSVRVLDSLVYGANAVDIDVKPGAGNLNFRGNNISCGGGFRLRAGPAAVIDSNVFAQQSVSTNPHNALVDIDGDLEPVTGVLLHGNRFQTEQHLGNPLLLRINNVSDPIIWGNSFRVPEAYAPVEFTANCIGAKVGPNSWDIEGAERWSNRNPRSVVQAF